MMHRDNLQLAFFVAVIAIALSCFNCTPLPRSNIIHKPLPPILFDSVRITLEHGGCGLCLNEGAGYSLFLLYGSGEVSVEWWLPMNDSMPNPKDTLVKHIRQFHVSQEAVRELLDRFWETDFNNLQDNYPRQGTDIPSATISLRYGGKEKLIHWYDYWSDDELKNLKDRDEARQIKEIQYLARSIEVAVGTSRFLK
jgi:hypothetical protein